MDFSIIQGWDMLVLGFFNSSNNALLDQLALILTSGFTWIPLYLMLFVIVVRNNETMGQIALAVGGAFLCILLTEGLADGIVKPLAERWRPCNDPIFKSAVQLVNGYSPRGYSFCSAHAANTMAIAVFFACLVRSRLLSITLVGWSLVNAWTRLYLAAHYPSDVLCGLLLGAAIGYLVYLLYLRMYRRISPNISYISNQYTRTGYDLDDVDMVMVVMMLTIVYVLIRGVIMGGML